MKKGAIIGIILIAAAVGGVFVIMGNPINILSPANSDNNQPSSNPDLEEKVESQEDASEPNMSEPSAPQNRFSELRQYALKLINEDRAEFGLSPVSLSQNEAAQAHAEDALQTREISHWTTDGMKPYMRYSLYNGTGYVAQNIATQNTASGGWIADYRLDMCELNDAFCFKAEAERAIKDAQYGMMNDDLECCANGHRDNILEPHHTHVSLGIAFNSFDFAYVQNFENQYIIWENPITLDSNTNMVSMNGKFADGMEVDVINLFYDPVPTPQTYRETVDEGSYGLGPMVAIVVEPAGPGAYYDEPEGLTLIEAQKWRVSDNEFDISFSLDEATAMNGAGVYTVAIWALNEKQESLPVANIAVFRT